MSRCQHGSPWPSPATRLYRRSLPVGFQGYILQTFVRLCEGVNWRMGQMSSSLLLQQCPECLVRLTVIVFVMGGRYPYSCCFVGCCFQDLFNTARSTLVWLPSSFFSIRFFLSEAMGSSLVDVKADEPNDWSTPCLTRCWAYESRGTTAMIKYFDRRTTAAYLLGWLL